MKWANIPSTNYAVSEGGDVVNLTTMDSLKPFRVAGGRYLAVDLHGRRYYVHHLVAQLFIGPRPRQHIIHHEDHENLNNTVENLDYVLQSRNMRAYYWDRSEEER